MKNQQVKNREKALTHKEAYNIIYHCGDIRSHVPKPRYMQENEAGKTGSDGFMIVARTSAGGNQDERYF